MRKARLGAALALAAIACAPFALAQQKPKPGDKATPKPPASATATSTATSTATAPSASASSTATAAPTGAASGDAASAAGDKPAGTTTNKAAALNPGEGVDEGSSTDVTEAPGQRYYFIGLRYRGNLVPRFMINIFVDEGKSVYTNSIGVELDMRKDDFSLIPAISYAEYGTGDILFKEKGKPASVVGNYSVVNSALKAMYFTADLLWSAKLGKNVDFEYGAGFGLGIIFGDLVTNWVRRDDNGPIAADETGRRYSYCTTEDVPNTGCNKADHQNSTVAKVGGYNEPSWANGGSKPNIFPWIAIPQIGLRIKPVKQFQARFGIGFSLTGFWFGLSGDYGFEQPDKKGGSIANAPTLRF